MTQTEKHCFNRLVEHGSLFQEIRDFMLDEGMLIKADLPLIAASTTKPKYLTAKLDEAKENGKIQLISFEWSLLPVEKINLIIVTARSNKTFNYENL